MGDVRLTKGQLKESTNISVLDSVLKKIEHLVDIYPYKAERTYFFGMKDNILLWKIKCDIPHLENISDNDEKNPVNEFNAPPFFTARMCREYVGVTIGNSWHLVVSRLEELDGNKYMEYIVSNKYESVINLLILLKIAGKDVDEELRAVIFEAINRKFESNIESIELAGVDDVIDDCLETIESSDPKLVSRHILLAGPPGCGKSEIVKAMIKKTPEWVHYTLSNDINNWKDFMKSLNKLMVYLKRRVMIIVDEIDEIGLDRNEKVGNINKIYDLLRVMDGVTDMGHIKFVATTNRPAVLDPALKRIGRFGPIRFIDVPSDATFIKIVEFYNERYKGKVDTKKIVDVRGESVGSEIRAAFEDCIIHKEKVTTENVIKNLTNILDMKKIEAKDYV